MVVETARSPEARPKHPVEFLCPLTGKLFEDPVRFVRHGAAWTLRESNKALLFCTSVHNCVVKIHHSGSSSSVCNFLEHILCRLDLVVQLVLLRGQILTPAGHSFSRDALLGHLRVHGTCPIDRTPLAEKDLYVFRPTSFAGPPKHCQFLGDPQACCTIATHIDTHTH